MVNNPNNQGTKEKQNLQWKVANTTTWQIFKVGTPTVVLAAVAVVVLLITTVAGAGYFVSSQSNVVVNEAAVQQPISVEAPAAPETGPVAQEQPVVDERQLAVQDAMQMANPIQFDLDIMQLPEATSFQIMEVREKQLQAYQEMRADTQGALKEGSAASILQPQESPKALEEALINGTIYMRTDTSSLDLKIATAEGDLQIKQLVGTFPILQQGQAASVGNMLWAVTETGKVVYLGRLWTVAKMDANLNELPIGYPPNQTHFNRETTVSLIGGILFGDQPVNQINFIAPTTIVRLGVITKGPNYEVPYDHKAHSLTFK